MNIQEYISSGAIEAYVLGLATAEEARELEQFALEYPEVKAALSEAEASMEQYAMLHAVAPPEHLKNEIWEQLSQSGETHTRVLHPAVVSARENDFAPPRNARPFYRNVAIAASLLLVVSIGYSIVSSKKQNDEIARMAAERNTLVAENNKLAKVVEQAEQDKSIVMKPGMKQVLLAGVPTHEGNEATVYWDAQSKDVYLALNKLPETPKGKQYQLWAIVDGKPVDAGVYTGDVASGTRLVKMKNIPRAEMFAVTLEQEGGSSVPTLEAMYVAGKI